MLEIEIPKEFMFGDPDLDEDDDGEEAATMGGAKHETWNDLGLELFLSEPAPGPSSASSALDSATQFDPAAAEDDDSQQHSDATGGGDGDDGVRRA